MEYIITEHVDGQDGHNRWIFKAYKILYFYISINHKLLQLLIDDWPKIDLISYLQIANMITNLTIFHYKRIIKV